VSGRTENMGAWTYVDRRIENVLLELDGFSKRPIYVGRSEAASPATGNFNRHTVEQEKLISQALNIDRANKKKPVTMPKHAAE
jgi:2-oxoglutarate dehydrogenase E1 component